MNWPLLSIKYLFGCSVRFTPPAIAMAVRPWRKSWHARWIAVSELEHIVSTVMLGPCKFRQKEVRLAMLAVQPAKPIRWPRRLASAPNSWYSLYITPA